MATEQVDHTVVTTETPTPTGRETIQTDTRRTTADGPGPAEMTRRITLLVFGLIQIVIGARFVLLLLDAREANGLVSAILDVSQVFVGPFEGILRTDALTSAGSVFDVTAVVAFIGWTALELIVIWAAGIFRHRDTHAGA